MSQLHLPMLTVYAGPRLLPHELIAQCKTYRDAVRLCYAQRTRTRMTNAQLAEEVGCNASHIGDYVNDSQMKVRRNLPAEYVNAYEVANGNRAITQWQTAQAGLTILESFLQPQLKAA